MFSSESESPLFWGLYWREWRRGNLSLNSLRISVSAVISSLALPMFARPVSEFVGHSFVKLRAQGVRAVF